MSKTTSTSSRQKRRANTSSPAGAPHPQAAIPDSQTISTDTPADSLLDTDPPAESIVSPHLPELSPRQQEILEIIRASIRDRGFPPSIREIGEAAGLASTSSVAHQLRSLQQKGYLRREANRPRAVDTRYLSPQKTHATSSQDDHDHPTPVLVPLVGRIAAGSPVLADEHVEELFPLPRQLAGSDDAFLLSVTGDSMRDAGIHDGDWVVIRPTTTPVYDGEIIAALFDDEATVKTFRRIKKEIWLYPENKAYSPFRGEKAKILGKVTAVLRKLSPTL